MVQVGLQYIVWLAFNYNSGSSVINETSTPWKPMISMDAVSFASPTYWTQVLCNFLDLLEPSNSQLNLAYQLLQTQHHSNLQARAVHLFSQHPFLTIEEKPQVKKSLCYTSVAVSLPLLLDQVIGSEYGEEPCSLWSFAVSSTQFFSIDYSFLLCFQTW